MDVISDSINGIGAASSCTCYCTCSCVYSPAYNVWNYNATSQRVNTLHA
jgi:hypothetical protein